MRVSCQDPGADAWYRAVLDDPASFPFRFTYGGRTIEGFPESEFSCTGRQVRREEGKETAEIERRKDDGLYVTLRCSHYHSYGVSEWTVWFENRGGHDTRVPDQRGEDPIP